MYEDIFMKKYSILFLIPVFFQGASIQERDEMIKRLVGTWIFQEGRIVNSDLKLGANIWGIDTMTFETNKTFKWNTPYSDSLNKGIRHRANFGNWDVSADGKYLKLSETKADPPYTEEDIELDSIGNTLRLKIIKNTKLILFHHVRILNSPGAPANIRPGSGITKAKITYLRAQTQKNK